jgi:formate hydrogenlyase subunit 3/multisubunit Na+/H+ antiporter MnhD subunit
MSPLDPVGAAVGSALAVAALAAAAGLLLPADWRSRVGGGLLGVSGVAAALAGAAAAAGHTWGLNLPDLLPLAGARFAADALSGWFVLLVGAVTAMTGIATVGYAGREGHGAGSRTAMLILPLFTASMVLVPLADSVATFLWCWELMALTSLLLVATEHRHHSEVRTAVIWYAAMTQCGFVTLLIGLSWLATVTGGDFVAIRAGSAAVSGSVKAVVFLLCVFGFASKAGAVPLHPWLPRAHAEAPSHVSALMSAAMVKLGIYGLLRVGFDLLGGGTRWWWLVVALLGAASALYGIVQAAVAADIKRLLAFSTSENIGLILLGVGFAGLFARSGQPALAALAVTAALLHTVNHAGFKTLLFLGAGSVAKATGTRNLDLLGGLSRRMPATTGLVAAGALAAAALPPGNGFVSEWLLLQSLLYHGPTGTLLRVAAPIGVAVIALTAGVGVATYVKAVGTGFLARPRSAGAAAAHESPPSLVAGMGVAALACAVLAVAPTLLLPAIQRTTATLRLPRPPIATDPTSLTLAGLGATLRPLFLACGLAAGVALVALAARALGRARRRQPAWDCGDGPLTARMEYTATSYAEPLQRVFDDTLAPEHDVDVTHDEESAYHIEAVRYRQRIPDRVENRLYRPLITALGRVGEAGRRLAPGVIHRYLAYMLVTLIVVLVAGALP